MILSVPGIHCAGCVARIEKALEADPRFRQPRVNVTRKTVELEPVGSAAGANERAAIGTLADLGFEAHGIEKAEDDPRGAMLVRALAVAGFAAMNIMLLSVSVWSGAEGSTQHLFHWISAAIAVPAVVYSGRPFFLSAWKVLRTGHVNMDVPISLAVVLATGMSLYQTAIGDGDAYFDAAVMLLFFLLAGRALDHHTRIRMRRSLSQIAAMMPRTAHRLERGASADVPAEEVRAGEIVRVLAGEHVPLDVRLLTAGLFDLSHATGESEPVRLAADEEVVAGAVALEGPVDMRALRPAADSFVMRLADMLRRAESVRSVHVAIADRAAAFYTPLVHFVAAAAAAGWLVAGAGWHQALTVAVATLIITCPCALGLAVPAVHTVALDILYRARVMVRDGAGLERLRDFDMVVVDKTGTLTLPSAGADLGDDDLAIAAALAGHSSHPLSRAIVREARHRKLVLPDLDQVRETTGAGVSGMLDGTRVKLGSSDFAGDGMDGSLFLERAGRVSALRVSERLRPGATAFVDGLHEKGMAVLMLTGDREGKARDVANTLGIDFEAGLRPDDKLERLEQLAARGHRVLMVGDGVNDGPALAAAHVSIAPGSATDLGRNASDLVLLGESLDGATLAIATARRAHRHILQNFAIAAAYNLLAVPLAVSGVATPLMAAIAMSSSSILVTLNAVRLRWADGSGRQRPTSRESEPVGAAT